MIEKMKNYRKFPSSVPPLLFKIIIKSYCLISQTNFTRTNSFASECLGQDDKRQVCSLIVSPIRAGVNPLVPRMEKNKNSPISFNGLASLICKENGRFWHTLLWALGTYGLKGSALAACNICFLNVPTFYRPPCSCGTWELFRKAERDFARQSDCLQPEIK